MDVINKAKKFAIDHHDGIFRKYTDNTRPYAKHPEAVAYIVEIFGGSPEMIAAAWLHDVVEDPRADGGTVSIAEIEEHFGADVAYLVDGMTKVEEGKNRAARKKATRDKLASFDDRVKTIKLADILHNSGTIFKHDAKFTPAFIEETLEVLPILADGHPVIHAKLTFVINKHKDRLGL